MTREIKLALILGSALVLVVGVLISDHLSGARNARIAQVEPEFLTPPAAANVIVATPEPRRNPFNLNMGPASASAAENVPMTPTGTLVDPTAPVSTTDAVVSLLPPAAESAPQLSPSEQEETLLKMAREENVPLTYEPPATQDSTTTSTGLSATNAPSSGASSAGREIVVREGDTLWSLAETHLGSGAQFAKLLEVNRDRVGTDGDIRVGTKLRMPGKEAPAAKPAPASKAPATAEPKPTTKPAAPKTYTVKKGDTLGSIAASTLGTSKRWKDLLDANPGLKPANLAIGTQIKLPPK